MGKIAKKPSKTIKEYLDEIRKVQEEYKILFLKAQGAIEVLETMEGSNEKTD
jgi:hypothetical protein